MSSSRFLSVGRASTSRSAVHVARRSFSAGVKDNLFDGSAMSSFQQSFCAPLPPNYKFDPAKYRTVPTVTTTMPNGMRVASETTPGETATVGVFIDAGSRYESDITNGTAHFLEHMNFKGTQKRTQQQLETEIENMGGHLNAYTSREQTVYYAKVLKQDVPKAVDILSDILLNSELKPANIERERGVILRELDEVCKSEEEVIYDDLHGTAYQTTALGRTILGPVENIQSIKREHLVDFIKANYTAPRMCLVGAGAVDHQQLVELAEKGFQGLRTEPEVAPAEAPHQSIFVGSDTRYRNDDMEKAHVALAFEGVPWSSGDSFAQMVMQALLGNWDMHHFSGKNMASPMCSTIAERGLATNITTFNTQYSDTSLFGVYGICDPDTISDMCWVIMREAANLAHRTSDEDVARAVAQLKANLLFQLDGTSQICEDIGRQLQTYRRRLSVAEIFARLDAVDAPTVRRVASELISDRDIAVAARGPLANMPDYGWLRRRTYMLRY